MARILVSLKYLTNILSTDHDLLSTVPVRQSSLFSKISILSLRNFTNNDNIADVQIMIAIKKDDFMGLVATGEELRNGS